MVTAAGVYRFAKGVLDGVGVPGAEAARRLGGRQVVASQTMRRML
jgi:hypothetical protein